MSESIDWKGLIEAISESATAETMEALKENQGFLKEVTKDELVLMMHHISTGSSEIDGVIYSAMLRQLTDEQFLDLRKKSVVAAKTWSELNSKKDKMIKDLSSKVGKATANIIIRFVLLGGL